MKKSSTLLSFVALLLAASSAFASNFRPADTVYLPAVIRGPGANNTQWRTDVWIANLSNDRLVIDVAFAPSAVNGVPQDNRSVTLPANLKTLEQRLNPGQRIEIKDFLGTVFGVGDNPGASGALIFFATRENGPIKDCELANNDCREIAVQARIYTNDDPNSYGQLVSGLPWHSYISVDAAGLNLDKALILGVRNTADFRTNIGILNASQYSTTTIRARLINPDGTQFGSEFNQSLPPLGHIQLNVITMFPGYSASGGSIVLDQTQVQPVDPGAEICPDGCPGFFAYGSLLANTSNDPTYLETTFMRGFSDDDVDCLFFGAKTPPRHLTRR